MKSGILPDFKQIREKENNFMSYENKWQKIEEKFDKQNNLNQKKVYSTVSGLSISDLLIMYHWLNYAKLINDLSYKELNINFPHSEFISQQILNQIDFRKKEFIY